MNRKTILSTTTVRRLHARLPHLSPLTPSIEARIVYETEMLVNDILTSLEHVTKGKVTIDTMRTLLAQRGYKFCL
jgi:hypothetical protein